MVSGARQGTRKFDKLPMAADAVLRPPDDHNNAHSGWGTTRRAQYRDQVSSLAGNPQNAVATCGIGSRRWRRGWPARVLAGTAYGVNQSARTRQQLLVLLNFN